MTLNKIKTFQEYLEEGFTQEELFLAALSDYLFNDLQLNDEWRDNNNDYTEKAEIYFVIVEILGL